MLEFVDKRLLLTLACKPEEQTELLHLPRMISNRLRSLSLVQFKNYSELELELGPKLNCFVGRNGEGKTNILDAVYYLAFCKSFFNPVDSQNIQHDQDFFVVQGVFDQGDKTEDIFCGIKKGQSKNFKRNKKKYEKLSEHIGLIPLVMISPADSTLIIGGSDVRRKFVDSAIAQFNKSYLHNLLKYQKALSQRNALLKSFAENRYFEEESLRVWDEQLIQFGTPIFQERKAFLDEFIPIFQDYYERISLGREPVDLEYYTSLNEGEFKVLLQSSTERDRALRYTSVGIHKDDMVFRLAGKPMKKFGSQGQQKSYLIALKLAQFAFIKMKKKMSPLLLLDDIFDKLDADRVTQIIEMVAHDEFGQIMITDTHKDRMLNILERIGKEYHLYEVADGKAEVHGG